jgi:hypothetical protein
MFKQLLHARTAIAVSFVTVLLVATVSSTWSAAAEDAPLWSPTGDMLTGRRDHAATLLLDGRVLVIGWAGEPELFDPATGQFASAGGPGVGIGQGGKAIALLDGTVLLVPSGSIEARIYDPGTGTFRYTGRLSAMRGFPNAIRLQDGQVLVVGGTDFAGGAHSSAELYSPADGTFRPVGSLNLARVASSATLLPDGRALFAGGTEITSPGFGQCVSSAELYDPSTETFSITGNMTAERCSLWWSDAPVLSNGKVLVAGGASADLYDPVTGTFAFAGWMTIQRIAASVTLLSDGRVLVAGGTTQGQALQSAELYDPSTGGFVRTVDMSVGRLQHAATRLRDGRILVTGGHNPSVGELRSAELFSIGLLDQTPPLIEPNVTPRPNSLGWHNTDVTVAWSVTDPESGIVSSTNCETTTIVHETTGTTLTCSARNGAGLTSAVSVTARVDKTAPAILFSGNLGTYTVDQTILITCAATDDRSGLATTSCPDVASGPATDFVGSTATTDSTLTATATDNAGNDATADTTFTVTVTASGICRLSASLSIGDDICTRVTSIATAPNDSAKEGMLRALDNFLAAPRVDSVPADVADVLSRLAHLL